MKGSIHLKTLVVSLFLLGVSLPVNAEETTIACKKTERHGLHHQCQDVKVLKNLNQRSRLFQMADKRVITLKNENIFKISELHSNTRLEKGQTVMVSSKFFWNKSHDAYKTICKLSSISKNKLDIQCGHTKPISIERKFVYLPVKAGQATPESEKTIFSTTQKSTQKF